MTETNTPRPLLHQGEMDQPGFRYSSTGLGVHQDLINAVIESWRRVHPYGAADALRAVDTAVIFQLDNLARLAALAVAQVVAAGGYVITKVDNDVDD